MAQGGVKKKGGGHGKAKGHSRKTKDAEKKLPKRGISISRKIQRDKKGPMSKVHFAFVDL